VLLNTSDGTFINQVTCLVGSEPYSVFSVDLDSDGDMDIITANIEDNNISVLLNTSDGTFLGQDIYPVGGGPTSVFSADLDSDGDLDIISTKRDPNNIFVLLNINVFGLRISSDEYYEQADTIQISYYISNPESNPVNLLCEYSINNGLAWNIATITGDTTAIQTESYEGSILWDSSSDLPGVDINPVMFKITPYDSSGYGKPDSIYLHLDNNRIPSIAIPAVTGEQRLDINIPYQLSDIENDTLDLLCEFFYPSTKTWEPASISGDTSGLTNYSNQITWNSNNDLPEAYGDHLFRITPYDNDPGISDTAVIFLDQLGLPVAISISQFSEEQSGNIEISFSLADDESDTINIIPEYSVNSGETWSRAAVSGNYDKLSSEQYSGSFIWHSESDLPGIDIATARFRITPDDGNIGIPIETADFHLDNNLPPKLLSLACPDSIAVVASISFSLSDTENDTLHLDIKYSPDQGQTWKSSVPGVGFSELTPSDYSNSFNWYTYKNFGFNRLNDVWLKFTVWDNDPGTDTTLKNISILNYPAEFTGDLLIDTDDLAIFAAAWNAEPQDTIYDIGPATGTVPELVPIPDGELEFEDLAVFIMMWNWSFENNGFVSKPVFLSKYSSGLPSLRLVQRYVDDPWNSDGLITIDVYTNTPELMMMDGLINVDEHALKIHSVREGKYLKQSYQSTPLLSRFSADSSLMSVAMTGLGKHESVEIYDNPVFTITMKNRIEKDLELSFDYTLRNITGEIIETNSVSQTLVGMIPQDFTLSNNYPNPFNSSTVIEYAIPEKSNVSVEIYDLRGYKVHSLVDSPHEAHYYRRLWNAKDDNGRLVASGLYFMRIVAVGETRTFTKTKKMVMIR